MSLQGGGEGTFRQNVSIVKLRQAHHKLAQLCALGMPDPEIAAISGYTPQYISNLRGANPAFQELVAHYGVEARAELLDLKAKQQRVAELALDEMTDRLAEAPEGFSNRELLEVVEVNLVRPEATLAKLGQSSSGSPSPVTIQFVTATESPKILIEGESK